MSYWCPKCGVCIVQVGWNARPKQVCLRAAEICRKLAERFDRLALEKEPCKEETHKRINR
jgi:hypothetical protein